MAGSRGEIMKRGRTSLRHFWLRIAYSSRMVALSLAMVLVLRRLASLNDFRGSVLDSTALSTRGEAGS
jgi:hypothetical protein